MACSGSIRTVHRGGPQDVNRQRSFTFYVLHGRSPLKAPDLALVRERVLRQLLAIAKETHLSPPYHLLMCLRRFPLIRQIPKSRPVLPFCVPRRPSPGPSLRDPDHVEVSPRLLEHVIDLLQRPSVRLGEKEEDDGHGGGIDDRVDDVVPRSQIRRSRRRDLRDDELAQPLRGVGDGGDGDAQLERRDLGGVEERLAEEADGEEEVVQVDGGHGDAGDAAVVGARGAGEDGHADGHAGGAEHEELAAAEAVDGEDRDDGAAGLEGSEACCEDAGWGGLEAKIGEDGMCIED